MKICLWLCVLGVLCVDSAFGQITVGVEAERARFTYHFDNPSSADTSFLVPHFFEQTYNADNVWLSATVRYVAGIRWETSGGITPRRSTTADDYDTFFDPDGTVIVSGTTGPATIRSLRFSQRAELARVVPVRMFAGYRLRIDRTDFGVGHKTATRNGVLVSASDVTTRGMTSSHVHEVLVGGVLTRDLARGWTLSLDGEAAPTTVARLVVELPDKYPGQDLVFLAKVAAVSGRAVLARRVDRWIVEISIDAGRTWSYTSDAVLARNLLAAGVRIGRVW